MNPAILARIAELLERRVPFAVATVVDARGSVPGKVGARMIVFEDGRQEGTVGGAGLEEKVKKLALEAIRRRRSGVHRFELARQKPGGLDSVCGGGVEVFVEYLAPGPHLLICGGGHVGLALAHLCDQLDYGYSVADERAAFASAERFPRARERFAAAPRDLLAQLDLGRYSHVLLVGHSHHTDGEILAGVLERDYPGYLGVIGSEAKRRDFRERCVERGIGAERFDRGVVCPIGLPIDAQTPAEIAVAVLAQIIRDYRSTTAAPLDPTPPSAEKRA